MTSFIKLAAEVWRDYVTIGNPASGAHTPQKADIREWGATVETKFTEVAAEIDAIVPAIVEVDDESEIPDPPNADTVYVITL